MRPGAIARALLAASPARSGCFRTWWPRLAPAGTSPPAVAELANAGHGECRTRGTNDMRLPRPTADTPTSLLRTGPIGELPRWEDCTPATFQAHEVEELHGLLGELEDWPLHASGQVMAELGEFIDQRYPTDAVRHVIDRLGRYTVELRRRAA